MWTNRTGFKWEIIVLPISVKGCLILSTQLKELYPPSSSHISGSSQAPGTGVSSKDRRFLTSDSNYPSNPLSLYPHNSVGHE